MKSLKEMKYLLLDLDGVCYGSHNGYPLEKVFGLVSKRMTLFIQEKLGLDEKKAKELQTNYFYKYNSLFFLSTEGFYKAEELYFLFLFFISFL